MNIAGGQAVRVLKFRGWDAKAHTMLYFANPQMGYGDGKTKLVFGENFHDDFFESTIKAYLMQFTGLQDINGQEIYQSDIVKIAPHSGYWIVRWEDTRYCIRLWEGEQEGIGIVMVKDANYEVIGNVYEHPELLGEGKSEQIH